MKKREIVIIVVLIALIILVWRSDFVGGRLVLPSSDAGEIILDNPIAKETKHMEKPVETKMSEAPIGYLYEVTQLFFKTEQDDVMKEEIRKCLDECGILYENLYYTSEGYYTVDLVGYKKVASQTEYEKLANSITDQINEWRINNIDSAFTQAMVEISVDGWYYILG